MKVIIKGSEWKIKYKKNLKYENETCLGLCDYGKKTIILEKGMDEHQELETLIHEMIHATLHELLIDIGRVADEVVAEGLSQVILQNFHVKKKKRLTRPY